MRLPVALTTLVGREREADALRALLAASRLVTVTGAGGSGKTRLAMAVAADVAAGLAHGAAWVELAPLADGRLLASYAAGALGLDLSSARAPEAVLEEALRERELLLVLDNCEHLVDACAALADALLRACPRLRILATSRQALGVAGERAWLVPALSLPAADDAAAVEASEAVRLFVDRAQSADAAFRLTADNGAAVARVCRRLDGLPLAIELAAARVRALTPAQIAERLGDSFRLLAASGRGVLPRHRTLRGTIEWSHDLLTAGERVLFQRLSVFAGTFDLDAAEAVCGDRGGGGAACELPAEDVLDLLAALVDKSLVVMAPRGGEARYRLLEVVRQYAAERLLAAGGREEARARHAAHYLALAERTEPHFFGFGSDAAWAEWLEEETPNFRAAADWFAAAPERAEGALRLMRALYWHWFTRGRFVEGRQRIEAALPHAAGVPPLVRGEALTALGFLAFSQGDRAAMRAALEESVALLRGVGNPSALAYALVGLGVAATDGEQHDVGRAALDEAVAIATAERCTLLATLALYWRGSAARFRGEPGLARASLEEAVRLARELGGGPPLAHTIVRLGIILHRQGEHAAALRCFTEAVGTHRRLGDRWGSVHLLEGFAGVAAAHGQGERAARLVGASDAACRAMGVPLRADLRGLRAQSEAAARAAIGEAAYAAALAEGGALTLAQALDYAEEGGAPADAGRPQPAAALVAPAAPAAAPALRVLALGPLEIHRDGERLPDDAWRSMRARELLLYLLSHPEGRTRERIGLAFWPDASAAQVKNNFHVTLHHLRKTLGRADLIAFEGEVYRVAWERGVEFDALAFERGVREGLRRPGDDDAAAEALRTALAGYRGELLADERVGDWHLDARDRLARLHAEGLRALGLRLERAGRHAEAADVYRRLVGADPLGEEGYRRLMTALARAGERGQALRQYDRLVVLLRAELETDPEPETSLLRERVRRAEAV